MKTPTQKERDAANTLCIIVSLRRSGEDIDYPKGFDVGEMGFRLFGCDVFLEEATNILRGFCKIKGENHTYNLTFKETKNLSKWLEENTHNHQHETYILQKDLPYSKAGSEWIFKQDVICSGDDGKWYGEKGVEHGQLYELSFLQSEQTWFKKKIN